jgi:peptidoglycan/xylan/chitin deacetylase (PgdA/CDA1 family)
VDSGADAGHSIYPTATLQEEDRQRRRDATRKERTARQRQALVNVGVAGVVILAIALLIFGGGDDEAGNSPTQADQADRADSQLVANARQEQRGWVPHEGPVPILMYHEFGDPGPDESYPDLFVSDDDFRAQIQWLEENGYEAVTLDRVEDAWYEGGTLPPKPIVLSFDDGYLAQFEFAFPLMKKHGWPGVLNLKTEDSGLYSENVKPMIRAGWELASHTNQHLDLPTLDDETLRQEVAGSRKALQEKYGVAVDNFCYPSGAYDERVVAAVEAAGYRGATTTDFGLASSDERFTLKRLRINRGDGAEELAAILDSTGA